MPALVLVPPGPAGTYAARRGLRLGATRVKQPEPESSSDPSLLRLPLGLPVAQPIATAASELTASESDVLVRA